MKTTKRILIIEDERAMARALQLKLQHAGFEAETAENGEEGLSLLEKSAYNLVLLDLVMPKMDGFAVLEAMKANGVNVPVIILSNLSQAEDEKRARDLGAKDFFIKSNTPIADIVGKASSFM